jgi:hypothetical protein
MNTDGYKTRRKLREQNFRKNMLSSTVKCSDIDEYAKDQQASYDKDSNQILYGTSTVLKAAGVSDGTCNQTDPLLQTNRYKCGLGVAGGNPCVPDTYNYKFEDIEGYESDDNSGSYNRSLIEEFEVLNRRIKIAEISIAIIVILFILLLRYCD